MKRFVLLLSLCVLSMVAVHAQDWYIGIMGGKTAYNGDLSDGWIQKHHQSKGAFGITLNYEYSEHFTIRAGYMHGKVTAFDKYSSDSEHIKRNLNFQSKIDELSLIGEYYVFSLSERRYSPYFFGGLALFHFNPYTYDTAMKKVYLKPLSTEGEGLSQYPGRKPYSLTQVAIPFGAGLKFVLTDNIRLGLEVGLRKLFTDYLDDVSTNYADPNDLLAAKGPEAVALSYRGGQRPGGSPAYPAKGAMRGNPSNKDWYYFYGAHLTFRLGDGGGSSTGRMLGRKKGYGCPSVPL